MTSSFPFAAGRAGTRRTTPGSLAAKRAAAAWDGLPGDIEDHWELLRLLERSWRALGLNQVLFCHLSYLVKRTRAIDWWAGSRPVVWESLDELAERFGCCRRTIRNRERALAELGFLTWRDSGNHQRGGSRDANGRILCAYGVDLSPFAAKAGEMRRAAEAEEASRRERSIETRRRGHLMAEIRQLLTALGRPEDAGCGTPQAARETGELRACNRELAAWRDALRREALGRIGVAESDDDGAGDEGRRHECADEGEAPPPAAAPAGCEIHDEVCSEVAPAPGFTTMVAPRFTTIGATGGRPLHYKEHQERFKRTTRNASRGAGTEDAGERAARKVPETGIEHIRLEDVLAIATPRLAELLPAWEPPDWRDVIAAASVLRTEIGASKWIWLDGVALMGPAATAVAVIVAHARSCDPRLGWVRNPGGFLRGCLRKAEANDLHLHRTVFGLAARRAELAASAGSPQAASAAAPVS